MHGYPVTVFEKESRAGGMLLNGIPSFRLEKDIIEAEIDVLRQMGVEFKYNMKLVRTQQSLLYAAKAIKHSILRLVLKVDVRQVFLVKTQMVFKQV